MEQKDISLLRLSNQGLTTAHFKNAAEVVGWLGAVQSQDYAAAKWALGLRIKNATDNQIEKAYNEGTILRTHVMRPTWHFVLPTDIGWMLKLTAPRVKKLMAHYDRKLEITDDLLTRCRDIFSRALQGKKHLTRAELEKEMSNHKILAHGQRLGHIVMHMELESVICSGSRRGKQFTYALLEEQAPQTKKLSHEEALGTLALTYFRSHGPAQLKDFSWWSGLTIQDATKGIELTKSKLKKEVFENKTYWYSPETKTVRLKKPTALLLSIYDEYTIAYKDRSALGSERYVEKFISMGSALTSVIVLDGKVVGTWKRILKKETVELKLNLFMKLNTRETEALDKAAQQYGSFHKLPIQLT